MNYNEDQHKDQQIKCAKKIAQLTNETSQNIAECMDIIDKNNTSMTSFPLEFIAFAEKIAHKLSNEEIELLSILSQKVIGIQKINTENFRLVVELADMQRQRVENALDDYREIL